MRICDRLICPDCDCPQDVHVNWPNREAWGCLDCPGGMCTPRIMKPLPPAPTRLPLTQVIKYLKGVHI
jgi:hypothetical protein